MLTRWSDFEREAALIDEFRRRMDHLFDDYGRLPEYGGAFRGFGAGSYPRMDLRDEGNHLALYAEVPGLSDKDIQISLNQNVLSISG